MKTAAQLLCGTLLAALAMNSASAEPVTVKFTGQVVGWSGTAVGQVSIGQSVTAMYSYDTRTPDLNADPTFGLYRPAAAQGASVRVDIGPLVFESLPTSRFEATVIPPSQQPPRGMWVFQSFQNKPLDNGSSVDIIGFGFGDNGTVLTSDALPSTAPDLQLFPYRELIVQGAQLNVRVEIASAELVPATIEISPSAGRFLNQQRFDAAVLLPVGAQVSSMHASVLGTPIALSFPGTCHLLPPNSMGRPALLCPDAHNAVASIMGEFDVNWQVTLTDGSVLHNYVTWSRNP